MQLYSADQASVSPGERQHTGAAMLSGLPGLLLLLFLLIMGGSGCQQPPAPTPLPPMTTPTLLLPTVTPPPTPSLLPTAAPLTLLSPTTTPTLTPLPTPQATTVPGSVLSSGETWYDGAGDGAGWSLTVDNFSYEAFHTPRFTLRNHTGRTVVFPEFSTRSFRIVSDAGETFAPCTIKGGGSGWYNTWWSTMGQTKIEAGGSLSWQWTFHPYDPDHRACDSYSHSTPPVSSEARTLTLVVEDIANMMTDARWRVEIPRP